MELQDGDGSNCKSVEGATNPPIAFEQSALDLSVTHLMSTDDAAVMTPLEHVHNVSILVGELPCTPRALAEDYLILRDLAGGYWRHDPRLETLANPMDAPANGTSSALPLPVVAKTFVNRGSCQLVESIAADGQSVTYASAPFQLNASMLRSFYLKAGKLTYAVDTLRLEAPYDTSPCTGVSRWRRQEGACAGDETALNSNTQAAISAALLGSQDANAHVVDVEVRGACTDAAALGAKITVNGACFTHVHPETLNVYDFSYWPAAHPGGASKITQFATAVGVVLAYPLSHDMDRWKANKKQLVYLGRMGDVVDFQHLPSSLQTAELAAMLGSEGAEADDVFEACGSPGEVANVPSERNLYNMFITGIGDPPDGRPADVPTIIASVDYEDKLVSFNEKRTRDVHVNLKQGKNIVWTMVVLQVTRLALPRRLAIQKTSVANAAFHSSLCP